jgi:hypothetical protein
MSTTREPGMGPQQPPALELCQAFAAAEDGHMPSFTAASLLCELGLDGERPDGLTLIDRFTGNNHSVSTFRTIVPLMFYADGLIQATNEYRANPAQEAIAHALGAVVSRQVTREGDICPGAKVMALNSTREDIIPPEVRAALGGPERDTPGERGETALEERIIGELLRRSGLFGGTVIIIESGQFPPDPPADRHRRYPYW